jgi:hypothetical protein
VVAGARAMTITIHNADKRIGAHVFTKSAATRLMRRDVPISESRRVPRHVQGSCRTPVGNTTRIICAEPPQHLAKKAVSFQWPKRSPA